MGGRVKKALQGNFFKFNLVYFWQKTAGMTMVSEIGIGIGIRFFIAESESDESAGIEWIESVTRIFLAEACFVLNKVIW